MIAEEVNLRRAFDAVAFLRDAIEVALCGIASEPFESAGGHALRRKRG
jgi:hypothetical protein